ncbi:hypothetical protein V1512DRAFT_255946 [Lipomyces arxii]|uniref:uncharacterized protein n=1 Tax=Lipomyces arxii TaxID=56418 RepID=UPI0034CF7655
MTSTQPEIETQTSDTFPISELKDASGQPVSVSSILPSAVKASPSPRGIMKKTVSFHKDTKPPSVETPTIVGKVNPNAPGVKEEIAMVVLDYLMILIPLVSVHTVLDVLVYRQYQQEVVMREVGRRAMIAFGVLFVLHSTVHPAHKNGFMQMLLMLGMILVGSYLIHAADIHDYFAVMKQAPPLGTLLVWFAIELEYYWSIVAGCTVGFVAWCVRL